MVYRRAACPGDCVRAAIRQGQESIVTGVSQAGTDAAQNIAGVAVFQVAGQAGQIGGVGQAADRQQGRGRLGRRQSRQGREYQCGNKSFFKIIECNVMAKRAGGFQASPPKSRPPPNCLSIRTGNRLSLIGKYDGMLTGGPMQERPSTRFKSACAAFRLPLKTSQVNHMILV